MGAKNFVNQFKNTRRLAGLQGRRPPGGQAMAHFGKTVKNSGRISKNPRAGQRPVKKYSGPKSR